MIRIPSGLKTGNIDFYSKGKGHVRYKLEQNGKNEDWQYGQANQTILFESIIRRAHTGS